MSLRMALSETLMGPNVGIGDAAEGAAFFVGADCYEIWGRPAVIVVEETDVFTIRQRGDESRVALIIAPVGRQNFYRNGNGGLT